MRVAVVGLGTIGLPLAVQFASGGHQVRGADINPGTVETINAGTAPLPNEADLPERLAQVVESGALRATTDTAAAVASADVVVVVVPLVVNDAAEPDFGMLDAATVAIAAGLRPGTVVSYETTLPVGTVRRRFWPMLATGSGLARDAFHVVFSPERVFAGRIFADLRRYPKLVGGVSPMATEEGIAAYTELLQFDDRPDLPRANGVWDLGTAEAAEMAKLAETTYRDVNIGLANQFARYADRAGIDIAPVIEACNSQPFSHIHRPGIAVGGHCIPVYPRLYLWNDADATIVSAARAANEAMPEYAVDLLERLHGGLTGVRVAVLGISYRGGVKGTAFSGVFPIIAALTERGAIPVAHDPLYETQEVLELGLTPYRLGDPAQAAILHADHPGYRELDAAAVPARTIVDGRRLLDAERFPDATVIALGSGRASAEH